MKTTRPPNKPPRPNKTSWAARFRELMTSHVAALGASITPAQRAIVRSAVTMQIELEMQSRRFALKGTGASAGDITLYAKISSAMSELLESLTPDLSVNNINVTVNPDDGSRATLARILGDLIAARKEREQAVVIDGTVIDGDQQQRGAPLVRIAAEPERADPATADNVVHLQHAAEPPAPVNRPKTSTELFYEQPNAGRPWWGPVGDGSYKP